ncbi:hypothetical protein [Massilia sp. DWR3-1-1]|uniref:hypothetical protein n=1 Tax=Massilia sp. DWR3-1-1 TaxID=2804559 RepID=UPI003CE6ED41
MTYSTELRNAKLDANSTVIGNAGKLEIYAGTDSAGTTGPEGTLLATFTLGSPFAPAASGGVQSPTLPAATTGVATGTAGWARVTKADGSTTVMDLTVGTSGAQINLSSLSITTGGAVSITAWSITAADA